jgi:hypothetical protein
VHKSGIFGFANQTGYQDVHRVSMDICVGIQKKRGERIDARLDSSMEAKAASDERKAMISRDQ